MLPNAEIAKNFEITSKPSKDYKINTEKETIRGIIDKKEAVKQAIYCILDTERYQYPIYSRNYGIEAAELIGKPKTYAMATLKRIITEALTQDDRITGVEGFSFSQNKNTVSVTFTVKTIYGDIEASKEVSV